MRWFLTGKLTWKIDFSVMRLKFWNLDVVLLKIWWKIRFLSLKIDFSSLFSHFFHLSPGFLMTHIYRFLGWKWHKKSIFGQISWKINICIRTKVKKKHEFWLKKLNFSSRTSIFHLIFTQKSPQISLLQRSLLQIWFLTNRYFHPRMQKKIYFLKPKSMNVMFFDSKNSIFRA